MNRTDYQYNMDLKSFSEVCAVKYAAEFADFRRQLRVAEAEKRVKEAKEDLAAAKKNLEEAAK